MNADEARRRGWLCARTKRLLLLLTFFALLDGVVGAGGISVFARASRVKSRSIVSIAFFLHLVNERHLKRF